MTHVVRSPALPAWGAVTSESKALRRQPKVTLSTVISGDRGKQRRIEAAFIFKRRRSRHQNVVVTLAPLDLELAAGQRDLHDAVGALETRRGHRGSGCRRAARLCQASAALPGPDGDVIAIDNMRERDVGAFRK